MRFRRRMNRVGVVLVAVALTLCPVSSMGFGAWGEETTPAQEGYLPPAESEEISEEELASVEELQLQRQVLQLQASQLQAARQYYTTSLEGLLQQKSNLDQQIELKQREIKLNDQIKQQLTVQIDDTNRQLQELEHRIALQKYAISEQYQSLRQKLRAMAKDGTGEMTTIQMLVNSASYADYLINSKMAARLSEMEQNTVSALEDELARIEDNKALLQTQRQSLEDQRKPYEEAEKSLNDAKEELLTLRAQADQIAEQLNANISYYRTQYTLVTEQQKRVQTQINAIVKDTSSIGVVAMTAMYWPAPGSSVITSSYKERWGRWHYGIDIADWGESTGNPIVAASDGVVVFAGYDADGYGNYLMIDHGYNDLGQRIITLYGHAQLLYVAQGDIVYGGQTVIASMGSTGNSTGAHLHFEVRVDGTAVDPVANGYINTDGISIQG